MPLALYMDVHVPAAITEGLRRRGVDVLTSQEDGTRRADDDVLLARATELGRILFTQDGDLLALAATRQEADLEFPGLVFGPQEGASVGLYIEDLELICKCCDASELLSTVWYLPLK